MFFHFYLTQEYLRLGGRKYMSQVHLFSPVFENDREIEH